MQNLFHANRPMSKLLTSRKRVSNTDLFTLSDSDDSWNVSSVERKKKVYVPEDCNIPVGQEDPKSSASEILRNGANNTTSIQKNAAETCKGLVATAGIKTMQTSSKLEKRLLVTSTPYPGKEKSFWGNVSCSISPIDDLEDGQVPKPCGASDASSVLTVNRNNAPTDPFDNMVSSKRGESVFKYPVGVKQLRAVDNKVNSTRQYAGGIHKHHQKKANIDSCAILEDGESWVTTENVSSSNSNSHVKVSENSTATEQAIQNATVLPCSVRLIKCKVPENSKWRISCNNINDHEKDQLLCLQPSNQNGIAPTDVNNVVNAGISHAENNKDKTIKENFGLFESFQPLKSNDNCTENNVSKLAASSENSPKDKILPPETVDRTNPDKLGGIGGLKTTDESFQNCENVSSTSLLKENPKNPDNHMQDTSLRNFEKEPQKLAASKEITSAGRLDGVYFGAGDKEGLLTDKIDVDSCRRSCQTQVIDMDDFTDGNLLSTHNEVERCSEVNNVPLLSRNPQDIPDEDIDISHQSFADSTFNGYISLEIESSSEDEKSLFEKKNKKKKNDSGKNISNRPQKKTRPCESQRKSHRKVKRKYDPFSSSENSSSDDSSDLDTQEPKNSSLKSMKNESEQLDCREAQDSNSNRIVSKVAVQNSAVEIKGKILSNSLKKKNTPGIPRSPSNASKINESSALWSKNHEVNYEAGVGDSKENTEKRASKKGQKTKEVSQIQKGHKKQHNACLSSPVVKKRSTEKKSKTKLPIKDDSMQFVKNVNVTTNLNITTINSKRSGEGGKRQPKTDCLPKMDNISTAKNNRAEGKEQVDTGRPVRNRVAPTCFWLGERAQYKMKDGLKELVKFPDNSSTANPTKLLHSRKVKSQKKCDAKSQEKSSNMRKMGKAKKTLSKKTSKVLEDTKIVFKKKGDAIKAMKLTSPNSSHPTKAVKLTSENTSNSSKAVKSTSKNISDPTSTVLLKVHANKEPCHGNTAQSVKNTRDMPPPCGNTPEAAPFHPLRRSAALRSSSSTLSGLSTFSTYSNYAGEILWSLPENVIMKNIGSKCNNTEMLKAICVKCPGLRGELLDIAIGANSGKLATIKSSKVFFIVEGTVSLSCDISQLQLSAGSFFIVRKGELYSITNVGDLRARLVVVSCNL